MISNDFPALHLNDPCGRLACGPGWGREREVSLRLPDLELWLVWRGRGWMATRDRKFTLRPGFCAIMRPGGIYDAGHDESAPLGITYIHFHLLRDRRGARRSASVYVDWPEFFEVSDLDYFDSVMRRIVELFPVDAKLATVVLSGLLQDLLRRPSLRESEKSSAAPPFQHAAITQLTARLRSSGEPLPSVTALAEELHLSPAHFSRVFKKCIGQSPLDFLVETRLARARHLLRETNLSVGAISERLDYADVYFFSRQFKQKTGFSPLEYRRRL